MKKARNLAVFVSFVRFVFENMTWLCFVVASLKISKKAAKVSIYRYFQRFHHPK